jgi:membrane-associated phospholipid phosphatase
MNIFLHPNYFFLFHLCSMQSGRSLLRERAVILATQAILLVLSGSWIGWAGKSLSFRLLTEYHTPSVDFFFRYFTHFGDGLFILALAVALAYRKKYLLSAGIVGGYLLSGVFAQLGKRILNLPRPKAWFEALGETVYQVPGVEVHMKGSFPSGHTASVFALAVFLMLMLPYRWYSWLILIAAWLVGYSRIYLSQHFPVDVWAGAMIGTFSGSVVWLVMQNSKYLNSKFQ